MKVITSRHNMLLQHIRKLQASRAYRYQCDQFVADGTKLFQEAVRWYSGLDTVITTPQIKLPDLPPQVTCVQVPVELMQWLSQMQTPQGVIFTGKLPQSKALQMRPGTLVLDGIQDPGNLGTILRTADALDVPVVLSEGCADPYSAKTIRATMGAIFRTQPHMAQQREILSVCQTQQIPLAVTALTETAVDIRVAEPGRCAVVIGSEGQGVSDFFLQAAQRQIIIPMNPHCESLNAAVAAAILMWQMRQ